MADAKSRVAAKEQAPELRVKNFKEVAMGYNKEEAIAEASRCLECKNPRCVAACPVSVKIPQFIKHVKDADFLGAAQVIHEDSSLPAICGRVCPQESQCEGSCIRGIKGQPIAIGKLERFVADWSREKGLIVNKTTVSNNKKVAVVGSGPAGLSCASDLAKFGYNVTVFEALHVPGGVLEYGIPEFRLPKSIVNYEISNLEKMGVVFEPDVVIGRTISVDDLMAKEGYCAVFIGSGAGLPKFMHIAGENLNGVVSANEFLTRVNLMRAFDSDYDTPVYVGKNVVVVGGGNVAMDAARCAVRLGAKVTVVYRRSEKELPARREEVVHAQQEGIAFQYLSNPVQIIGNVKGWVEGIECVKMELVPSKDGGRNSVVEIPNSNFNVSCDMVIMALGTSPNPLISSTTPGLKVEKWGGISLSEPSGETYRKGVFAGGDAVTGAATVILAMSAGRKAAKAIDEYLKGISCN